MRTASASTTERCEAALIPAATAPPSVSDGASRADGASRTVRSSAPAAGGCSRAHAARAERSRAPAAGAGGSRAHAVRVAGFPDPPAVVERGRGVGRRPARRDQPRAGQRSLRPPEQGEPSQDRRLRHHPVGLREHARARRHHQDDHRFRHPGPVRVQEQRGSRPDARAEALDLRANDADSGLGTSGRNQQQPGRLGEPLVEGRSLRHAGQGRGGSRRHGVFSAAAHTRDPAPASGDAGESASIPARDRGPETLNHVIDHLLAVDPGRRGIAAFFVEGGAAAAAGSLLRARRVLLTTGFTVGDGLPETDGPPGTASLGRALRMLDKEVGYVTDEPTVPLLAAALQALGESPNMATFPANGDPALAARRLLAERAPTHLVSVERPGRTADGDYLSARGQSVRPWNAPIDALFIGAPRHLVTVGIGDGGNEIGMGNVRARIGRAGALARRIVSVVKVHHLVVAGTSNWGGYGIVAELSGLVDQPLLHSADEERKMIQACVDAGAVDGITRRSEPTVDGLPLEAHVGMLELLRLFAPPSRRANHTVTPTARGMARSRGGRAR